MFSYPQIYLNVFKEDILDLFSGLLSPNKNKNKVKEFEEKFAEYIGSDYCVAMASGRQALFNILRTLDLEPGDEVIFPAF